VIVELFGYLVLRFRNEGVVARLVRKGCNLSPSHRFAAGPSLSQRERDLRSGRL